MSNVNFVKNERVKNLNKRSRKEYRSTVSNERIVCLIF